MPLFDVIVIGAGPNGLAAACKLQKQGRRVLVLERGAVSGGGAAAADFAPGFARPSLAHLSYNLDPRVEKGMNLAGHGLAWANANLSTTALSATGGHLRLDGAMGQVLTGDVGAADRAAWAALRARLMKFARVLAPFREMTPPRLAKGVGNPMLKLAGIGVKARLMGADEFRELLRVFLTNMHDALNDELSNPMLKGALAFDASLGTWLGPRSPNSLLIWLERLAGQTAGVQGALGLPKGGMASIGAAMVRAAEAAGVVVRSDADVARVIIENDRVAGVQLASGEELRTGLVVSAIAPKTTLLSLVGPRHLDTGLVNRMRHQKSRGGAAKLHLALTSAPDFRGADLRTRLVIAPSEDHVERAFNPVKYGRVPDAPVMEIVIPSAHEAGHAPEGQHFLSAIVQFAPHAPADPEAARAAMLEACLGQLEAHAPGIRKLVAQAEMLMPYDIEARWGMPGGNWHHGEMSVEQMLFLRPLPGMAQYQTPIAGLWLASAGCHPGGGVSGAAGWNAANAIERSRA
ncbi:NAD(P)/FAD-dependent oxidoreductase [Tabrizicola sp.]|uniref:phytoene desaturase family protein n=1 Tax=Tabrizicola sp. TaxID=2005166 RepID=UPI00286C5C89|nr:NAD(P)/FAD-dependent oxidoreductase [Tabrizicola sp.]